MQQRTSGLHLRFSAATNLHFKPVAPFNQLLCMPSQPLLDLSGNISERATQSYLRLYAGPRRNFITLLCILRRKTRWLTNYSIGGPNSFPHAGRNHALIPCERKAAAHASPDRKATNRASTSSPPIGCLSPGPLLGDSSPLPPLKVWAAKQIKGSFGEERQ